MQIVLLTRIGDQFGYGRTDDQASQSLANLVPALCAAGHSVQWLVIDQDFSDSAADKDITDDSYQFQAAAFQAAESLERQWFSGFFSSDNIAISSPQVDVASGTNWRDDHSETVRNADLVIVGLGSGCWRSDVSWIQRTCSGIVAAFDSDANRTVDKLRSREPIAISAEQLGSLDLYLTSTGGYALNELATYWGVRFARPMYPCAAVNTDFTTTEPMYHLGYYGNWTSTLSKDLDEQFASIARELRWLDFAVAGSGYPQNYRWPFNVDYYSEIDALSAATFFKNLRVALELSSEEGNATGYCPSQSLLTAAANRTPVLMKRWPGMSQFFELGTELLTYNDRDDIIMTLQRLGRAELAEIGVAARDRVARQHTPEHRVDELEWFVDEVRTCRSLSLQ